MSILRSTSSLGRVMTVRILYDCRHREAFPWVVYSTHDDELDTCEPGHHASGSVARVSACGARLLLRGPPGALRRVRNQGPRPGRHSVSDRGRRSRRRSPALGYRAAAGPHSFHPPSLSRHTPVRTPGIDCARRPRRAASCRQPGLPARLARPARMPARTRARAPRQGGAHPLSDEPRQLRREGGWARSRDGRRTRGARAQSGPDPPIYERFHRAATRVHQLAGALSQARRARGRLHGSHASREQRAVRARARGTGVVMTTHRKLWWLLGTSLCAAFFILGFWGREVYRQAPPIPERVVTSSGVTMFTRDDILTGQQVWQSTGGQQLGSIWGHGAYQAPDWSADWLHRELTTLLDIWAERESGQPFTALDAETQGRLRARLMQEIRTNTYDTGTGTVTISADRLIAIRDSGRY